MKIPFGMALLVLTPLAVAEEVSATPYRPTISNPAELSAPGWLEVEMGLARTRGGENQWQNNQPYTFKYAFTRDFGIVLGGDVRVNQIDVTGQEIAGGGDNTVLFKHRLDAGAGQAFGLEWGAKFDTSTPGIGSGKQDYILNGIYSVDVDEVRIDANLGATWLGLWEEGLGRRQYNWAVALSREVMPRWNLSGELSGFSRQGKSATSQALAALSYAVNDRLVLDFGVAAGTSQNAPDWSAFAGATWLVSDFR